MIDRAAEHIPRGQGRKALVAMSGGVDSSVAAALLQRRGYEVVGCFMRLGTPGESLDELCPLDDAPGAVGTPGPARAIKIGHQGCCSITDAADARLVAAHLGVPLYVCNFKKDFGRVIDYFVAEYELGRTPNPCVRCNDWLKFGKLHDYAAQIGAEFVASGHYARVEMVEGRPALLRGVDRAKDQSYVLFGARADRLGEMLLPIGALSKPVVREVARELGLPVHNKPDSQEICFVPDNDYAGLVERRSEAARVAHDAGGDILDERGERIGRHEGQHRFTIGQRRGHGVAATVPLYVIGKDAAANTITLGGRERLMCGGCTADQSNWFVAPPGEGEWLPVMVRHRYNTPACGALARVIAGGDIDVMFDEPQQAVTPGQALVLYDASTGDRVLGGGWIRSVRPA